MGTGCYWFIHAIQNGEMMISVGAYALFNGSLEMMPTPEQIEKTRIAAVLFLVVGTLSATIGLKIRPKKHQSEI